jgi:Cytochrome P460
MKGKRVLIGVAGAVLIGALATGAATSGQDRYSVKVPGGLAFSEFKGYERWETISLSHNGDKLAMIVGNPTMIEAFKAGIPGNGQPFPDGARMAKIHWLATKNDTAPGQPLVSGALHDVDFMVKDSKRFADSSGWGYAAFEYDVPSDSFRPGDQTNSPPQANDAKCGAACHTVAKSRDFVFSQYSKR